MHNLITNNYEGDLTHYINVGDDTLDDFGATGSWMSKPDG